MTASIGRAWTSCVVRPWKTFQWLTAGWAQCRFLVKYISLFVVGESWPFVVVSHVLYGMFLFLVAFGGVGFSARVACSSHLLDADIIFSFIHSSTVCPLC